MSENMRIWDGGTVRQFIGFSAGAEGDEKTNCSGLNAKRFVRVRKVILKIKGGT